MPVPAAIPEPTQDAIPFGPPESDRPEKAFTEMKAEGEDQKELRQTLFISHAFADRSLRTAIESSSGNTGAETR